MGTEAWGGGGRCGIMSTSGAYHDECADIS